MRDCRTARSLNMQIQTVSLSYIPPSVQTSDIPPLDITHSDLLVGMASLPPLSTSDLLVDIHTSRCTRTSSLRNSPEGGGIRPASSFSQRQLSATDVHTDIRREHECGRLAVYLAAAGMKLSFRLARLHPYLSLIAADNLSRLGADRVSGSRIYD
jgi:hypothetical protein